MAALQASQDEYHGNVTSTASQWFAPQGGHVRQLRPVLGLHHDFSCGGLAHASTIAHFLNAEASDVLIAAYGRILDLRCLQLGCTVFIVSVLWK